jgi:hypothetical protein
MDMDWHLFVQFAAPMVSAVGGGAISRRLERRPRLLSYLGHVSAVPVDPPDAPQIQVNAHSIVIWNAGKKIATNVRVGHFYLPSFGVSPSVFYETHKLASGGSEIVFPSIVPGEQLTITYVYFPPVVWSNINSYTKSDEGLAKIVTVLPSPRPSPAVRWGTTLLIFLGATTALYGVAEILMMIGRAWRGAG